MLLFTAVKRKKQTNILSGKSNGTYDKKLTCYCVGKWDSRQVQTWTSHSFEKGSFSTQLFKPCSLCEDYLYEEKNTLAKRPQADSHCDMDLVSHFAQQASRPLPILWDWVAESSYCRTSAREDGSSAASHTHVPWDPGHRVPCVSAFTVCCTRPVFWLSVAAVADARPSLICAPQILAGQAFPRDLRAVSAVEGLWFTPARNSPGCPCAPHTALCRCSPALLSIRFADHILWNECKSSCFLSSLSYLLHCLHSCALVLILALC